MITPKERIIKVFNKEIVDRPPCICPGGMMNMITTELMDKVNIFWPNAHLNGEKWHNLLKLIMKMAALKIMEFLFV